MLHGVVVVVAVPPDVEGPDDPGVRDLGGDRRLPAEAEHALLVLRSEQDLERDHLVGLGVVGEEHHPLGAPAELLVEGVLADAST